MFQIYLKVKQKFLMTKFFIQKMCLFKKIWVKKKIGEKNFWIEIFFGQSNFLVYQIFVSKKFLGQKMFWSQICFGQIYVLVKKMFWSKKSFWVKTSPLFARVAVMTFMRINNFESFLRIATHYMCIYINTWLSVFSPLLCIICAAAFGLKMNKW